MGSKKWLQKVKQLRICATLKEPFYILTVTLLTLILPLSFLLLARLSTAHYLFTINNHLSQSISPIFSLFLHTNPTLLHALVSIVSLATLIHGLTGKIAGLITESPGPSYLPQLYTAWVFLCTLQVCVGLGIEGSIAAGIEGIDLGKGRSLFSRVIFFLGLHETMLHWSRTVVKPVVDDALFGRSLREESWVQKAAMAVSFGSLWWWRLRNEVEALVIVIEVKKELLMSIGVAEFAGWCMYYLTVTIGMVRIVKGLICIGMVLLCRRSRRAEDNATATGGSCGNADKV